MRCGWRRRSHVQELLPRPRRRLVTGGTTPRLFPCRVQRLVTRPAVACSEGCPPLLYLLPIQKLLALQLVHGVATVGRTTTRRRCGIVAAVRRRGTRLLSPLLPLALPRRVSLAHPSGDRNSRGMLDERGGRTSQADGGGAANKTHHPSWGLQLHHPRRRPDEGPPHVGMSGGDAACRVDSDAQLPGLAVETCTCQVGGGKGWVWDWSRLVGWVERDGRTLLAQQLVEASDVIASLPVGLHPEPVSRHVLQRLGALPELRFELLALLGLCLRLQLAEVVVRADLPASRWRHPSHRRWTAERERPAHRNRPVLSKFSMSRLPLVNVRVILDP
eukprot:scaffold19900_cov94-Isochrysis_galbana.AAC.2